MPAARPSAPAVACLAVVTGGAILAGCGGADPASGTPSSAGAGSSAVAWRTGRDVRISGPDGRGAHLVLRLRRAVPALPTPSPDGRRVALVRDGRLVVSDAARGGRVRVIGRAPARPEAVRWSPDGRRVAVVGDGRLAVCDASRARGGCTPWADRILAGAGGATWSPDGSQIGTVRQLPARDPSEGDLAVVVVRRDGVRIAERLVARDDGITYPSPPVWTGAGLTWSTVQVRLRDGEFAGSGPTAVRRLEGDAVRTLSSAAHRGDVDAPFRVGAEDRDGSLVGVRDRFRGTATTFDLRRLARGGGTPTDAHVALGTFDPEMGNASADVLGGLSDGRVAVAVRPVETRRVALRLVRPGSGAGRVVRRADEVAIAAARPGNPVTP